MSMLAKYGEKSNVSELPYSCRIFGSTSLPLYSASGELVLMTDRSAAITLSSKRSRWFGGKSNVQIVESSGELRAKFSAVRPRYVPISKTLRGRQAFVINAKYASSS